MVNELLLGLKSLWPVDSQWKEVSLWPACFSVVARVTNSFLCGEPLCRNEEYLQSLEAQSTALFGGATLISITPKIFRPITGYLVKLWCTYHAKKVTKICRPYIEKRISETRLGNNSEHKADSLTDGLRLVINGATSRNDPAQLAVDLISDRLTITNNVTLYSVTFTVFHAILCLASSDPSLGYIESLREECQNALNASNGKWTLEAVRRLKLVDSAIRESMRMVSFSSLAISRTVIDPEGIAVNCGDADVIIPPGTMVALPIESIHRDESIYPDANKFDLFRFISRERQDDKTKPAFYTNTKPTTSADDVFYGFGTTSHPCPGRFLAVHEMKLILAHLVLNYDIEYTQMDFQPSNLLAMKVPKTDIKLRVRARNV